jgi:uncharacterized protein
VTRTQYLYRIQPTRPAMLTDGPTPEEQRIVGEHFAYLKQATAEGTVQFAGRTLNTDPSSFGIVIFREASDDAARGFMEFDPAVRAGVMRAELFPFRIALCGEIDE